MSVDTPSGGSIGAGAGAEAPATLAWCADAAQTWRQGGRRQDLNAF